MVDHALQQVISKLAPGQKRKVALLVQAFETVVPLPETGTSPTSNDAASSLATPVQTATASSYEKGSGKGKETNFGISLHISSCPDMIYKDDQDQVGDSCTAEEGIPESRSEVNEPSSEFGSSYTESIILTSEFTSTGLKENFGALNPDNSDHNYIVKDDDHDSINYCLVELGEANLRDKPPQKVHDRDFGFNGETLVSNCQINATGEQSDEPKSQIPKNLGGLIADYKANSSVSVAELPEESPKATEGEFTPHEESKFGPDKEEQADDANKSYGMNKDCSHQGFSRDIDTENHNEGSQKIELHQIEDIRMVEEAIDKIPLPDIQDESPDDHSVASNEPQFLHLNPEKEAEKVHLRHQDMEDRKNPDEWMLDYALQQVVAKLTPAQKRKVQLLVEASETVIPTIERYGDKKVYLMLISNGSIASLKVSAKFIMSFGD
ncbi:hypothetical protein GH714_036047 [Hevea brasiliensis]|uniref:Calmodulin-binding domain-containing protein n=1 Tax=Hevea brasiliensis TaxID=3981 RepID=A0A6A6M390_HEVBR|nr:hypothetical protein GH714_036047 [Hevea brasiliensis]